MKIDLKIKSNLKYVQSSTKRVDRNKVIQNHKNLQHMIPLYLKDVFNKYNYLDF